MQLEFRHREESKLEGKLETTIDNIRNLMHTQNWSAEKAMSAIGSDASEYPNYLALLQN